MATSEAKAPEGSVFAVLLDGDRYYVRARTGEAALERAVEEAGLDLDVPDDLWRSDFDPGVGFSLYGPLYGEELPDDESVILEVDDDE